MALLNTKEIRIHDDIGQSWQEIVNLISEISAIPATLIMRLHSYELEVFTRSQTAHNPYTAKERESIGIGLYCEAVINGRKELIVNNALEDPDWCNNPDIKLGMIAYFGMPLHWPNGDIFGTICMLDNQPQQFDNPTKQLLRRFQAIIETDLNKVYQQAKLANENQILSQKLAEQTRELERLRSNSSCLSQKPSA
ncbi:GAF domain-containing protein [Shewanella sp. 1CM18E]|uniref:GAF domain-containing protein n=1 Tax=Shewanella sp. 1CM18E TaxID=2929169 RepID=UPI0020BF4FA4|nr:GAF domain-containing protein [Shewanella sp. 1CM18E]MCK8046733.1 GAF domain-containing protein [Shewanella sp. 1CM18E]